MQIKWTIILLFILSYHLTFAQNNEKPGRISGIVIERVSKEPIAGATVKILQQKDSVFVTGSQSGTGGRFSINTDYGNYIVQVSFVGYKTINENVAVTSASSHVKLDSLFLDEDNILLSEAVVEARVPQIVVKGDTIEYNADSFNMQENALAEDLLKKIPGIEISATGKITVNGKEIKKVFVDGKEFFSDDPKIASKNLPAKIIDKVQVYEKKSEKEEQTGFKDGEEEQSINFTVKQEMKKGWFGNVATGFGNKERYETNFMLNRMVGNNRYTLLGGANNTGSSGFAPNMHGGGFSGGIRGGSGVGKWGNGGFNFNNELSKKLNVSGNVNVNSDSQYLFAQNRTETILSDVNTLRESVNENTNSNQNVSGNVQMRWTPDTLTTIHFNSGSNVGKSNSVNENAYTTTDANNDTINFGNSSNSSNGNNHSFNGNLMLNRKFKKEGRSLTVGFMGGTNGNNSRSNNINNVFYRKLGQEEHVDHLQISNNSSHSFGGYFSYVEPILKDKFIEINYGYSRNKSEQDTNAKSKDAEGNFTVLDSTYTRRNLNETEGQNIQLNFRGKSEKLNYQAGIGIQPSSSKRTSQVVDSLLSDTHQKVTEYAPRIFLTYAFDKREQLSLRYNGRTNHPSLHQLSAVPETSSPLYVVYGNPNLKTAFNNNFSVDYHKFQPEKQSFISASISLDNTLNSIVSSTFTDVETGRQETTYENINGNYGIGFFATFNTPLKNKKYTFSSFTNLNYRNNKGFANREINVSKNFNISERLGLNYRSEKADYGILGSYSYNKVNNSLEGQRNQEFMSWNITGNATMKLPRDFNVSSNITYVGNNGYTRGYNQNEVLWNASVSKLLFKKKNGNIEFSIYDILQQKTNISHYVDATTIQETTTNSLTGYFMLRFTYRFNIFNTGGETM